MSSQLWLMIHNAEQKTGDQRKLSLFGVGCCRRYWSLLPPESQAVLSEFELLLDRLSRPSEREVHAAGKELVRRANAAVWLVQPVDPLTDRWRMAVTKAVCYTVGGSPFGAFGYFKELDPGEEAKLAPILRDVFGNPFRPITLDPSWLTITVVALARQMYDTRDFTSMPILADALQDAGCEHPDILGHCRGPGPHVRGCWVVDLLLGKG